MSLTASVIPAKAGIQILNGIIEVSSEVGMVMDALDYSHSFGDCLGWEWLLFLFQNR